MISTMNIQQLVVNEFQKRFGAAPTHLVRGPGRVNLIGEHTDYNDGFVLPMAIDRATWMPIRPRNDKRVVMHGLDHKETLEFSLDALEKQPKHWGEYAKGTAWALQEAGFQLTGFDSVMACDVPLGAGLSSSASFEMAVAKAFSLVSNFKWEPAPMALLGQKAENKWVGVNCGIMDQMISAAGKDGSALLIDCRDLKTKLVPLPAGTVVVILDTATRRGLVDSKYNERRAQCEAAAKFFGVKALRDVTLKQFEAKKNQLDPMTYKRAHHVISENERTEKAAVTTDAAEFGKLMNASGDSLRADFEVTNRELDLMVDCARAIKGCVGARMTGAGFGGCAVALVKADAAQSFVTEVAKSYEKASGLKPNIYVCRATNGAEVV
jgi:galactokinase